MRIWHISYDKLIIISNITSEDLRAANPRMKRMFVSLHRAEQKLKETLNMIYNSNRLF